MLHSFIVWLRASPEVLITRVRYSKSEPRLTAHPEIRKQVKAILQRRTPYYAQADLVVDTTKKSPDTICKTVVKAFQNVGKPIAVR